MWNQWKKRSEKSLASCSAEKSSSPFNVLANDLNNPNFEKINLKYRICSCLQVVVITSGQHS